METQFAVVLIIHLVDLHQLLYHHGNCAINFKVNGAYENHKVLTDEIRSSQRLLCAQANIYII